MIYRDKFKVGDVVTWRDGEWAVLGTELHDGWREYACGAVLAVRPVTRHSRAVGHTQHVRVQGLGDRWWSGAYFAHSARQDEVDRDLWLTDDDRQWLKYLHRGGGGEPFSTEAGRQRCRKRGYAVFNRSIRHWFITDAGREALAQGETR
jgi:hypothetical protein